MINVAPDHGAPQMKRIGGVSPARTSSGAQEVAWLKASKACSWFVMNSLRFAKDKLGDIIHLIRVAVMNDTYSEQHSLHGLTDNSSL